MTEERQAQFESDSPRDTDQLHQLLQEHIQSCRECTHAVKETKPRGFGQNSRMCRKYFELVSIATGAPLPEVARSQHDEP